MQSLEKRESYSPADFQLILKRVGLKHVVTLFQFYGLHIDVDQHRKYPVNWMRVIFTMLLFILGCLHCAAFIFFLITSNMKFTFKEVCMCTILTVINIRLPVSYIHCILLLKKISLSLKSLSTAIERIKPESLRQSTIKKIRRWAAVTLSATILTTICGTFIVLYGVWMQYQDLPEHLKPAKDDPPLLLIGSQIFIAVWYIFGNSFLLVCSAITMLSCKIILLCFDCYIPISRISKDDKFKNRELPLWKHQYYHERLSKLVEEINEIVSLFMLSSLGEEFIIMLLYSRSGNIDWLIGLFLSLKHTVIFLLDTIACSAVNDKVIYERTTS